MLGTILAAALAAGSPDVKTLLVLPVAGDSADAMALASIREIYRGAIEGGYPGRVLSPGGQPACEDRPCALQAALASGADEVVFSSWSPLGSKWVFRSALLNAGGETLFNQRLTALSLEDMEAVTRRMAEALLERKAPEQAANLDNITAKEGENPPERRRSFYSGGASLGYLWPLGSSFSYRRRDYGYLPGDPRAYPLRTNVLIPHLSWLNTWEMRGNLLLDAELAVEFLDDGPIVGGDLLLNYLFGRGDASPFLGGGLGLHYVKADEGGGSPDKRNSGPTLNLGGGLMLFRTYDIHVLLRGQYRLILNSDVDNGFLTDVAVTYKVKALRHSK